MNSYQAAFGIGLSVAVLVILFYSLWPRRKKTSSVSPITTPDLASIAEKKSMEVFNDTFREELRNRGRLHFEKVINENALFLQQDLRLTTNELNTFMKDEIQKVLKDEFSKYEASITSARDIALESIKKTQEVIDQQRAQLEKQMNDQAAEEKQRLIDRFETNMADILNHYILDAIGGERIGIVFLGHQIVKLSGFPIQDVDPSVFGSYPYLTGRLHPKSINLAVVQVAVIPGHWPESQYIDPIFYQQVKSLTGPDPGVAFGILRNTQDRVVDETLLFPVVVVIFRRNSIPGIVKIEPTTRAYPVFAIWVFRDGTYRFASFIFGIDDEVTGLQRNGVDGE